MNSSRCASHSILFFVLWALSLPVQAVIGVGVTTYTEPTSIAPLISASDLVNNGSEALSSISSTPFTSASLINDGTVGSSFVFEESSQYPATIDFNFDIAENPLGYAIDSISVFSGWSQFESQLAPWSLYFGELSVQLWTLSYRLVGEASFNELITVSEASSAAIRQVTLVGLQEEIGGGVQSLRFQWNDPFPALAPGFFPDESLTAIREIDVFGSPIPEPNLPLIAFGSALFFALGRRRSPRLLS